MWLKIFSLLLLTLTFSLTSVYADDRDIAQAAAAASTLQKILTPQEEAQTKLLAARSLKCTFGEGYMAVGKDKTFEFKQGNFGNPTTIDAIDLKTKSARVIGNAGAEDLAVVVLPNGINFIETPGATLNVYTVFWIPTGENDEYYAVTSRHMEMMGIPAPSQYPGKCKIWGN